MTTTPLDSVLQVWQSTDPGPGCRVVGWGVGLGRYDFYQGKLCRLLTTKNGVSAYRPATASEQTDVMAAILGGSFQIEIQPVTGVIGGQCSSGTIAQSTSNTVVLHHATGRNLCP